MKRENGGPRLPIGIGLLVMSLGSGCLDVLSYHELGEVFPSAMTGNAAVFGLRLGQWDGLDSIRNGVALVGFIGGLFIGMWRMRGGGGRPKLLQALAIQLVLIGAFAWFWPLRTDELGRYGLIGASALAMGIQSAVAHRIGVHGVSTTYFTGTLANIVYGLVEPGSAPNPSLSPLRRVAWPTMAFITYLCGAVLASRYTGQAGRAMPPFSLSLVPVMTTLVLIVIIAIAGPKVQADA